MTRVSGGRIDPGRFRGGWAIAFWTWSGIAHRWYVVQPYDARQDRAGLLVAACNPNLARPFNSRASVGGPGDFPLCKNCQRTLGQPMTGQPC